MLLWWEFFEDGCVSFYFCSRDMISYDLSIETKTSKRHSSVEMVKRGEYTVQQITDTICNMIGW